MENPSVEKASAVVPQSLVQPSSDEATPGPSLDGTPLDDDPMDIDLLDEDSRDEHKLYPPVTAPASSRRRNDSDDPIPNDHRDPDTPGQIRKSISGNAHNQTFQAAPPTAPPTTPRDCEVLEDKVTSPRSATTADKVKQPPSMEDSASRRAQSAVSKPSTQESPPQGQASIARKGQQQPEMGFDAAMSSDKSSLRPIKQTDSAKAGALKESDSVSSGSTESPPCRTPPAQHVHSETPSPSNFHDDESDRDSKSDEMADQIREIEERLHALEAELAKKESDADMYKGLWKQTALEVERVRPRQWFSMAPDRVLTDIAKTLSYNIRRFAIQYFEGDDLGQKPLRRSRTVSNKASKAYGTDEKYGGGKHAEQMPAEPRGTFKEYLTEAAPGIGAHEWYLRSPRKRPTIIQSFLWRVLSGEVLGRFLWAGTYSESMRALDEHLGAYPSSAPRDIGAEHRYMTWRATTTALILNSELTEESQVLQETCWDIADGIRKVLKPYCARAGSSQDESFQAQIFEILSEALTLDREISKQTIRVNWITDSQTGEFDSRLMKLHEGESATHENSQVLLVVSPAMTRQGPDSTAPSSDNQIILLPMEVSCEPVQSE